MYVVYKIYKYLIRIRCFFSSFLLQILTPAACVHVRVCAYMCLCVCEYVCVGAIVSVEVGVDVSPLRIGSDSCSNSC